MVLGARAAARLGIGPSLIGQPIWLGGRWFTVVGILEPVSLVPMLDLCALIGWPAGERYLDFEGDITTLYVRTEPAAVEAVRDLLARTANPEQPNEVDVSRPSDALAAEAAADVAFTGLLLGLGAVALLVGGIGVANTMVISVLERRAEIGLRRSQGATRGHIRIQFFGEALLLALLGGGSGILIGWLVTVAYARLQGWPVDIPLWVAARRHGRNAPHRRHRRSLPRDPRRPSRTDRGPGQRPIEAGTIVTAVGDRMVRFGDASS